MNAWKIHVRKMLGIAAVAFCFLTSASAIALPPMGRESDGVIQSIDSINKTFTIKLEDESRLQSFEWNEDTKFLRDWKSKTSADLKQGVAVRIRYHSPIFGKPFVTRVIFLEFHSKARRQ